MGKYVLVDSTSYAKHQDARGVKTYDDYADAAAAAAALHKAGYRLLVQPLETHSDIGSESSITSTSGSSSASAAPDWSSNPWVGEDGRLID